MNKIIIVLISFFLLVSCNEDFPLNDDWQDITIVYGLLNSSDTAQYIKINKAFLGDGDIYSMAKESDSIQYNQLLNVQLIEYKMVDQAQTPYNESNWERTNRTPILLTRTNEIPKESGVFSNEVNYLYKTTEKIIDGNKYTLIINNTLTGKIIEAETFMIYKMKVTSPLNHESFKINMANELSVFNTVWESAVYGKIYQPAIQFHYLDIIGSDTTFRTIQINYDEQIAKEVRTPNDAIGLELKQKVGGAEFYQKIAQKIEVNEKVMRIPLTIDFIYFVGGQSFSTYLNVSKSSANYGQTETAYTNIKNGKGLFDCRFVYKLEGKELTVGSIDSLYRGRFTKNLGFVNYTVQYKHK